MRELTGAEVYGLEECLKELAAHHNEVSVNFRGHYPKRPFRETLESFREDVDSGRSRIAAVEDGEKVLGFCKADVSGAEGKIDYLIVLRECRGKGYGNALMDWVMELFRESGVSRIEVKVADGNDAAGFYERYGFRMNAHILRIENG